MNVQYISNKLSQTDYILLVLSVLYIAHNSPYVGVRTPAMFYASVVVLLFLLVSINLARFQNIVRFIIPIFSLYFLDIFFIQSHNINSLDGIMRLFSVMMQILIYPMLASYPINKGNVKLAMWLLALFLSVEFTTYITSIMAESEIPGIIRMNPGQLRENDQIMYAMKTSMNVGNFDTVYGCATLVPIGILLIKWRSDLFANKLYQLLTVLATAIMIYFVYVSQFATALVGTLLMTLTIVFPKYLSLSYFKKTIWIGLFAVILTWSALPPVLHIIADSVDSEIMAERFEGIAISLEGGADTGSEDIDERNRVYNKAISTITETYGIGGWGVKGGGGHSHILDTIAKYGIIGIALLIIYYKGILKLFYQPYKKEPWIYYYLYGVLGVTFFYVFNPSELFPQLLFCYPLSAFLINYKLHKI